MTLTGQDGATAGLLGGSDATFSFSPLEERAMAKSTLRPYKSRKVSGTERVLPKTLFHFYCQVKGKEAELKEARLKVARSPHDTKLKPWVRARSYHAPTSSEDKEAVSSVRNDAYYPLTPRRSVILSRPLTPKAEDVASNERKLVVPGVKTDGKVAGVAEGSLGVVGKVEVVDKADIKDKKSRRRKCKRIIKEEE